MTIEQCYYNFSDELSSIYEKQEANNITDWVFENVTGFTKMQRRVNAKIELDIPKVNKINNYLQRLLQHEPVQYVLHEAWFYKKKFYVDKNVLIPRPETEELVGWIIDDLNISGLKDAAIIDIGTGSGCVAISLKNIFKNINVTAIDVSNDALNVAKQNAEDLNVKINFLELDFLKKESWDTLHRYDVIVSNPPYITLNEKEKLSLNVTRFEPHAALFVEDENPFIFYKAIASFAKYHLNDHGKIYAEIHEDHADEVANIFSQHQFFTEVRKDIYGKKRMIRATSFS